MKNVTPEILAKAQSWLSEQYDEETRRQVQNLIDNDPNELTESFYRILEFGTGGLRGIMGVGTNRMNIYTVAMATQGLANYIKKMFASMAQPQVAIAYDCRNNSKEFARISAEVMTANGIKVFLFSALRPTPELSFAIRELKCQSGIVVTASHNPKEYNGYKVYWEDGGQVVSPHDKNIIAEVEKITDFSMVNRDSKPELIEMLDEKFDEIYLDKVISLSLSPKLINKYKDLSFVYTPIHGTGGQLMPKIFDKAGFKNFHTVEEQMVTDGNFPTVISPNPEEHEAMTMAIAKAEAINADVVLATDPDADRVGVAVKDDNGKFILLNGNQTACILTYYILTRWNELGRLTGKEFIVKTIVTTDLLTKIANKFNVKTYEVLTGFKYIADKILNSPDEKFICGGEESYGFLVGDFVRDKDAIISTQSARIETLQNQYFARRDELAAGNVAKAQDLVARLKAGEDFDTLLAEYGEDPGMKQGASSITGYLISPTGYGFDETFVDAAQQLTEAGQISDPVVSDFGVHIVKLLYGIDEADLPYDLVKSIVQPLADEDAQQTAVDEGIQKYADELGVKVYPDRIKFVK